MKTATAEIAIEFKIAQIERSALPRDRNDANLKLLARDREIIITVTERSQIIADAVS